MDTETTCSEIEDKINELKELIKHKRSICEHEFIKCTYYDSTWYDCDAEDGLICKKCQVTKLSGEKKLRKLQKKYILNCDDIIIKIK